MMVAAWLAWWSSLYSNSAGLRTAVEFAHVGGLVAGGGCAIAADRMTILAKNWDAAERRAHLRTLRHTHQAVIAGLGVLIVSGLLLFAADPETFLHSRVFWIKMGLVVALMINGWFVRSAGQAALASGTSDWRRLHTVAFASMVLWLLTTLAGAALPNVG
jgi:hypothetical protein